MKEELFLAKPTLAFESRSREKTKLIGDFHLNSC